MFGSCCYCDKQEGPIVEHVQVSRLRPAQSLFAEGERSHASEFMGVAKELAQEGHEGGMDWDSTTSGGSTMADVGEPKDPAWMTAKVTAESFTFAARVRWEEGDSFGTKFFLQAFEARWLKEWLPTDVIVWMDPLFINLCSSDGREIARATSVGAQHRQCDGCVISTLTGEGAIGNWNSTCPEKQSIKTGDRLLRVNGTDGEACELLCRLGELRGEDINLFVQRPRKLRLNLRSVFEPLGLELVVDSPLGVGVKQVKDGLLCRWNAANPSVAVKPGDRIIEVNGQARTAGETIRVMRNSEDFELTILSWPKEFGEFRDVDHSSSIFWTDGGDEIPCTLRSKDGVEL